MVRNAGGMDIRLDHGLGWYQKKIGAYDKEAWERNVERRVLRGVSSLPKKNAKFKAGLIDIDLVRGSTFKKKKTRSSWLMLSIRGAVRVLLYPFYLAWWSEHTSTEVSIYFLTLYLAQCFATYTSVVEPSHEDYDMFLVEIVSPFIVMTFLGAIHEQIASKNVGCNTPKTQRRVRTKVHKQPPKDDSKESGLESLDFRSKVPLDSSDKGSSPTTLSEPQTPEHRIGGTFLSSDDEDLFIAKSRSESNNLGRRRKIQRRSDGILYDITNLRATAKSLTSIRRLSAESGATFNRKIPHLWDENVAEARIESASSADELQATLEQKVKAQNLRSNMEWHNMSQTDCNYLSSSSENINSDEASDDDYGDDIAPLQCSTVDKVSCTIWEDGDCKKIDLSIFDIASAIVRKVESWRHSQEYSLLALIVSLVIALYPLYFKTDLGCPLLSYFTRSDSIHPPPVTTGASNHSLGLDISSPSFWLPINPLWSMTVIACLVRLSLAGTFFYLLCVAERTFTQRFLLAKHFCQLTSARRAYRSDLPHFRLNKVRNIKTWLSVRSYLRKHGPQQSVEAIVSTAFLLGVCVLSLFCAQMLRDGQSLVRLFCCECALWCVAIGLYMTRFMMLGLKINKKYRNNSILITEQINLYLHMEQKPHKKEELVLVNNVLKLASDLLKELESPFKISGICANPYLYGITKVICVSAFSATLSEILGFKLKLHKIKIK